MPNVSNQIPNRKLQLVMVMATAIAVIGGYYCFRSSSPKNMEHPAEETYVLKGAVLPAEKNLSSEAVADNQQEAPATKEAMAERIMLMQENQQQLQQRLSAPLMLVQGDTRQDSQSIKNPVQEGPKTATAIALPSLDTIIAQGNFIHAILEPAINSDLPGMLRAIVSEPVYAENGSRVLVQRGSRLIGDYRSGMMQGQSRIFIVWQRLITPEGMSVQLDSNGVDNLGVAGMGADSIDRHFWQRFGTASLLSMIGVGTATAGVSGKDMNNSVSAYRSAVANSFSQSANQSFQEQGNIAPTLRIMQGKPIMVFVARDLQFGEAIKVIKPSINIF